MRIMRAVLMSIGIIACGRSGEAQKSVTKKSPPFAAILAIDTAALKTTPSGLRFIDVTVGKGAEATSSRQVTVHYTGWLTDGRKFDSSRDRDEPFNFTLGEGQVIQGWDEGITGMKVGGRRKLVIPAELGYGEKGSLPDIPPGATLVFDIELLGVE